MCTSKTAGNTSVYIKLITLLFCVIITFSIINMLTIDVYAEETTTEETTTEENATEEEAAPEAAVADVTLNDSNGQSTGYLTDSSTDTNMTLAAGEEITVTSETALQCLYIKWKSEPGEWTLSVNGKDTTYGKYGFLHEYVELPEGTKECKIHVNSEAKMCDLFAYGAGELPRTVQKWEPPCDRADFLVFSTHADDEILFLGGVLVQYAGVQDLKVQLVYMTNYWGAAEIREHEKLDGIWETGVKHYPINAPFPDLYATSYEGALHVYNKDEVTAFMTEQVRRFQPLVVVTQDINGEYGHGGHMLLAHAVQDSVDHANEKDFNPESVEKYGTYDVPKTYLHLWSENKIRMDLRQPLDKFQGRTALEVASDAYKKHVSQQWCWFYVSDDYEYSCADFGMYRTTVGNDTGNDMMENVVSYEEQDRIASELDAKKKAEEEAARIASEQDAAKKKEAESKKGLFGKKTEKKEGEKKSPLLTILIVLIVVLVIAIVALFIIQKKIEEERRRRRRAAARRKKQQAARSAGGERPRSGSGQGGSRPRNSGDRPRSSSGQSGSRPRNSGDRPHSGSGQGGSRSRSGSGQGGGRPRNSGDRPRSGSGQSSNRPRH